MGGRGAVAGPGSGGARRAIDAAPSVTGAALGSSLAACERLAVEGVPLAHGVVLGAGRPERTGPPCRRESLRPDPGGGQLDGRVLLPVGFAHRVHRARGAPPACVELAAAAPARPRALGI